MGRLYLPKSHFKKIEKYVEYRNKTLEKVPFNLPGLKQVHKHLFQDVYECSGEFRQVNMRKENWFTPVNEINFRACFKKYPSFTLRFFAISPL